MEARYLAERVAWANNRVARRIGTLFDAYRPNGAERPLAPENRYLRLHVAISASPSNFTQTSGHGNPVCFGHFDSVYTQPGDYLTQEGRTLFIASQEELQPVMCIRTNRLLTIRRQSAPSTIGQGGYGGLTGMESMTLLRDWPASVLGMATAGTALHGLPTDPVLPQWTVLLPHLGGITILPADLVEDDGGIRGVVTTAEQTHLGWRAIVRQAAI